MNVGDRIRLKSGNSACGTLGISREQIGLVVDVDVGGTRTAVLIHFPEADVYTSALEDSAVDIVSSGRETHGEPAAAKDQRLFGLSASRLHDPPSQLTARCSVQPETAATPPDTAEMS